MPRSPATSSAATCAASRAISKRSPLDRGRSSRSTATTSPASATRMALSTRSRRSAPIWAASSAGTAPTAPGTAPATARASPSTAASSTAPRSIRSKRSGWRKASTRSGRRDSHFSAPGARKEPGLSPKANLPLSEAVRVEEAAGAEALHHFLETRIGQSEAALASAEAAARGKHIGLGIPGRMDDDRPRLGIAVAVVEPAHAHRPAVMAGIKIAGRIGTVRARFGTGLVGKMLEEAGMGGIGAAPMGDEMAGHAPAIGIEQEEARIGRSLAEIDDSDDVDISERAAVAVERGAGARDHLRIDDRIDRHARLRRHRADRSQRVDHRSKQP